ncbi:MAG: hypothetical protein IZT59_14460 [Verrucomicrobia bacterium]|nr:hypothetical protein [Verrucomicrobiota bacterium]
MILRMKFFFVLAAFGTLVSCNTSIGVWRDTKATYNWSKKKIQESNSGGGGGEQEYEYGAPVY